VVSLYEGNLYKFWDLMKVVRSGDLVSYCAEEGVRILGEGKFLVSDSFPGNERTKYCLTSKVIFCALLTYGTSYFSSQMMN
jgi:hypothetical protein